MYLAKESDVINTWQDVRLWFP